MTDLASSPLSEPLESTNWESNSTLRITSDGNVDIFGKERGDELLNSEKFDAPCLINTSLQMIIGTDLEATSL